ncbi:MAG: extracellular solute-binding protein [Thermomicrobiales bacterium]|jgi:trehalose transport system substrate-binding protein|nr:extracellular solute-binding protein [Thermomicrobiales bacterium]
MTPRNDATRRVAADLMSEYLRGRLDRRELLWRAGILGISMPALTAAFWAQQPARAAQDATPAADVELGNFEGRTLRMSVALAEDEAIVFEEVIVNGFREATGGDIQLIRIEAADVIRTLEAQVGAGEVEIDILAQDNNSLAPLVSGELVEEIPEAAEILPPETIEALLPVLQFDDVYYFLPARPNVQITYYNSARFEQYGLEPPRTWDELMAAAQAIQEQAGVGLVSIQGVPPGPVGVTVTQFIWQAGGDPLQINTEEAAAAYQFMQDLKPYLTPQYPTATFDTTNTYLLNESVVLAQNWPFGINVIVGQGGKTEILTYDGWEGPAGNALVLGGDVFGIVSGTPNRDMALDFVRFFTSRPIQETLTSRLGWPAMRTDAFGAVEEWQQPYFESVLAALEHTMARPNVTYWLQVEQILANAFTDIVTNGQEVQATLERYQGEIDALTG